MVLGVVKGNSFLFIIWYCRIAVVVGLLTVSVCCCFPTDVCLWVLFVSEVKLLCCFGFTKIEDELAPVIMFSLRVFFVVFWGDDVCFLFTFGS